MSGKLYDRQALYLRAVGKMLSLALVAIIPFIAHGWQPTLAFWQTGKQVFATVDSTDLQPQLSWDTRTRSVNIGGWGIIEYKAIVIMTGTCSSAGVASALMSAPTQSFAVPFTFDPHSVNGTTPGTTIDKYFTVCVIGKNFTGVWQQASTPTPSYTLHINNERPVVQSLGLNYGVTPTALARIPISFSATNSSLNITHFCLKTRLSSVAPATPTETDPCWYAVNNPSPGRTPSTSISFSNFIFNLGFATADYYVYAWAKSASGAVSYLSSLGNGTAGTDQGMIRFEQSAPPVIINVSSTNTDSPSDPITKNEMVVPAGGTVFIKWVVNDDRTMPANPVTLSYTTDDSNFVTIASNIADGNNGGCTLGSHTGCYVWTNGSPTSTYFKVRVSATDSSSLSAAASAPPNNVTPFEVIAGNTDLGLGTSASSAIIFPRGTSETDGNTGLLTVADDGTVFFVDRRGLMTISPTDGVYKVLMPVTGTVVTGPVATATLSVLPRKIALDYSNGLLIYDYNRILRLNLNTQIVSTLIGGSSTNSDNTLASDYTILPAVQADSALTLMPLPNGDIWFTSGLGVGRARNGSHIEVYTASDQRIHWKTPTGIGSAENASFDPSTHIVRSYGFSFNPANSQITRIRSASVVPTPGGQNVFSVSYSPTTFQTLATHIPYLAHWSSDPTITSVLGEMYSADRFTQTALWKYDPGSNAWVKLIGTGVKGACPDGTPALSCDVDIYDAFISSQGIIYIVDRNRIRTIDDNGNMLTLFGQPLSFGDGGLATSARIGQVHWIDRGTNGKIVFADNAEFKLRELVPGANINLVAGTGTDAIPDNTNPALNQPVSVKYWGGHYPFVIDKNDNSILYNRGTYMSKLDRSTGRWVDIAGMGSTSYRSADGLAGSAIAFDGYQTGPNGFNGSKFIVQMYAWDGTQGVDGYIKAHAVSDGTQSALLGVPGILSDFSAMLGASAGTQGNTLRMPSNGNNLSRVGWDTSTNEWMIHPYGDNRIQRINDAGIIGTRLDLPRGALSFTRVVKGPDTFIYYCANNARVYKYNLTTSADTQLPWPSSSIGCAGYSLVWDPVRNSIVFPISQNGLGAIAEIYDP